MENLQCSIVQTLKKYLANIQMLSDAEIGNVDTTALYGILRKLLTAQEDKEGINDHEEWGEVGFQIDDHTRGQLYSSNCCSLLFHNNALLCFFFLRCSSRRRPETTKRQTDYYRCHAPGRRSTTTRSRRSHSC